MNTLLLDLLALWAVLSAILVITASNPIIAVLFLIAVFISVSGYLSILGLTFLALTYLIIYVGAIAILFLFVIMLLDVKYAEITSSEQSEHMKRIPLRALSSYPFAFAVAMLFWGAFHVTWPSITLADLMETSQSIFDSAYLSIHQWDTTFVSFSGVKSLGIVLYTVYGPQALILVGLILLLALVGPLALCFRPNETRYYSSTHTSPTIKDP